VVDPGVGTNRKSVVVKTKTGHFIITPDNGTLTLIESSLGIDSIRNIDESINRRQNSASSYTFHGRDVYAFTAAKLAAHVIRFDEVGPVQYSKIITIPYQKAVIENQTLKGNISILDVQYGNLWSNIDLTTWEKFKALPHKKNILEVRFYHNAKMIRQSSMPFEDTFGSVSVGKPLAYLNSLMQLSFALNQGDMAKSYQLSSGADWTIKVKWAK
jgi:S-adenosylmethionine hydrolase